MDQIKWTSQNRHSNFLQIQKTLTAQHELNIFTIYVKLSIYTSFYKFKVCNKIFICSYDVSNNFYEENFKLDVILLLNLYIIT